MAEVPATEPVFVSPWATPEPVVPAAPAKPTRPSALTEAFWGLVSTLLLAGWIALWAGWLAALALVAGVFVHEFGHMMVINRLGCGPSRIRIIPFFGGAATLQRAPESDIKGVLIALAGPAFGLVAAVPFFLLAWQTGKPGWLAGAFSVGALNLINLAPAAPLDGAKALGPALQRVHPMFERVIVTAVALAGLAWALERGSWLFGAVIGFGALRAFAAGGARPPARPLSALEWPASVGLYLVVVGACAAVTLFAAHGAGIGLRQFSFSGFGAAR